MLQGAQVENRLFNSFYQVSNESYNYTKPIPIPYYYYPNPKYLVIGYLDPSGFNCPIMEPSSLCSLWGSGFRVWDLAFRVYGCTGVRSRALGFSL